MQTTEKQTNGSSTKGGTSTNIDKHSDLQNQRKQSDVTRNRDVRHSDAMPRTERAKPSFLKRHALVIAFLANAVVDGLMWAVDNQYTYRYFHSLYEDQLNQLNNATGGNSSGECGVQLAPEVQALENKISSESARWSLYWTYVSIGPLIISSIVLSMKCDQLGRRVIFLLPLVAGWLYGILLNVIVRFHLHPGYSLIGAVIYCACGSNLTLIFATLASVSDTHGKKHITMDTTNTTNTTNTSNVSINTMDTTNTTNTTNTSNVSINTMDTTNTTNTANTSNVSINTMDTTTTTNTTSTCNVSINTGRTDIDGVSFDDISTSTNSSCNAANSDSVSSKDNLTKGTTDTDANHGKDGPSNISRPNDNTNRTTKGNSGKDRPTNINRQINNTNRTTKGNNDNIDDELDMSREKTRALKLALLDIVPNLMGSASSFGIGYMIRYVGFFYTLVIAISLKAVLLAFAFCFITETGEQRKSPGFIAPLRIFVKAAKDPQKRVTLLLVYLAVMFSAIAINDEFTVLPTYQMSPPFCFSSIQLGWYGGAVSFKGVLSLPMLWLFRRLRLSESGIAGLGVASNGAGALLLSLVRESWVFFAVPFISIPGALTRAMAKTITSRLIGRSALASTFALVAIIQEVFWFLASTFALIAIIQEVFWFLGTNASTYLYQSYVDTVPTAPFFLASAAFWVSAFLYCAQTCYQRRQPLPTEEVLTRVS